MPHDPDPFPNDTTIAFFYALPPSALRLMRELYEEDLQRVSADPTTPAPVLVFVRERLRLIACVIDHHQQVSR